MADIVTFEEVAAMAARLGPADRRRLAIELMQAAQRPEPHQSRPQWSDIRGVAPNLLDGEDAQAWITRTREEDQSQRDQKLRRTP